VSYKECTHNVKCDYIGEAERDSAVMNHQLDASVKRA
jgi:hypothetical protein